MDKPAPGKRYLVLFKCKTGIHKALAYNWPHPCCEWNILYYRYDGKWEWETNNPLEERFTPMAWTDLPDIPKNIFNNDR